MRSQPPEHGPWWSGDRNATRLAPVCPQYAGFEVYARVSLQDEDCLYLNVFAPYEAGIGTPQEEPQPEWGFHQLILV